eukprot:symbB.v1.2.013912.t1/scaffold987.1/size146359/2
MPVRSPRTIGSIQRIVELLGGHWGPINLECQYEYVERALYRCAQKSDESADSYLARADIMWSELLAKSIDLKSIQSYVTLRGSLLSAEDKKRVILDSDGAGSGTLWNTKVQAAIRMLGANFFQDMTGARRGRGKTYDQSTLVAESQDVDDSTTLNANSEEYIVDEDHFEALFQDSLHEGDEDAALIQDFEAAATDLIQSDEDLAMAYNAYSDARRRLTEKFRSRGFWPISSGKSKGFRLKIAVVPGDTPFLLSNTLLRAIGAVIDTDQSRMWSSKLQRDIPLHLTQKGLFLMDLNDLVTPAEVSPKSQFTDPTETHVSVEEKNQDTSYLPGRFAIRSLNMALSQRLKNLQVKANEIPADLSHLQLEDLHQEKIQFGQKHSGKSFQTVWNTWVTQHYGSSTKGAHRKFMRYVELQIEKAEKLGEKIVVKEAQPEVTIKEAGKFCPPQAKTRPAKIPPEVFEDEEEDTFEMIAQHLEAPGPDVQHLEVRMLNLENALQRVISHLEDQAVRAQSNSSVQ